MMFTSKPIPGAGPLSPRELVTSPAASVGSGCCSCRLAHPFSLLQLVNSFGKPQLLLCRLYGPYVIRLQLSKL
jgi:hypothetical protein